MATAREDLICDNCGIADGHVHEINGVRGEMACAYWLAKLVNNLRSQLIGLTVRPTHQRGEEP